jgi:hypothetical protein
MSISTKIRAFHNELSADTHHRYRSWEHCYQFFRETPPSEITNSRETAALQLGFYLASWGMYRGSSFLLQRAYTVHLGVIDFLVSPRAQSLWEGEFGLRKHSPLLVPNVLDAVLAIRDAYAPFGQPTDTLITKVLLGTLGCLPACDRYFVLGFKSVGNSYSCLNEQYVHRLLNFCKDNLEELRSEQQRIQSLSGVNYPIMKLVDMYFWQIGYELSGRGAKAT